MATGRERGHAESPDRDGYRTAAANGSAACASSGADSSAGPAVHQSETRSGPALLPVTSGSSGIGADDCLPLASGSSSMPP